MLSNLPRIQARRQPIIKLLGAATALAALLQAGIFAAVLLRTRITLPFWDMLGWVDSYLNLRQSDDWPGYLWAPHNEHRMVVIRVLTALDVEAFRGSGLAFVIAATVAQLAAAVIVTRELWLGTLPASRPLAWLGAMLLLTTAAAVDCSIPINTVYPLTLVCVVAALALFDGEMERDQLTTIRRTAAILVAALAGMSNAAGLVAWPALAWSAWRGGASPRWLCAIGIAGVGYAAVYLHALPSAGTGPPNAFFTLAHLMKVTDYLFVYLGLPLSRAPALALPSRVLGAILLAAGCGVLLHDAFAARPTRRLDRIASGLILAALSIALLAALGRVDLEPEVKVPVRYAVLVAPLHIGLLARVLTLALRRQVATLAVGVATAALLLALQAAGMRPAIAAADSIAETLDQFAAGIRKPGMEHVVSPDLDQAARVLAALRARH